MTMVASLMAAEIRGIEAVPVRVEAAVSEGMPELTIVGMPDQSVVEARARVRSALHACGYELPRKRIVINLSPTDVRKTGCSYDLAIAAAILAASGQIPGEGLDGTLLSGELDLSGRVRQCRGDVARVRLARGLGLLPVLSSEYADPFGNVGTLACDRLADMRGGVAALGDGRITDLELPSRAVDFADLPDGPAKRAMVVAAAGGHNVALVGPAGAGKTMYARRLPTILPPLSDSELELQAMIWSAAGMGTETISVRDLERPFRAPHCSISLAGMIGGGRPILPGEVTLAHRGVLFLDDLQEFPTSVLRAMRPVIEDGEVRIVRAEGITTMPAKSQLVVAASPCPCGHLGDPVRECADSPTAVEHYQERLGSWLGALGVDVRVDVARQSASELLGDASGRTTSAQMRDMVMAAREFAAWREERDSSGGAIRFAPDAAGILSSCVSRLSVGDPMAVACVARTVADIEGHVVVQSEDVCEALGYRTLGAPSRIHEEVRLEVEAEAGWQQEI